MMIVPVKGSTATEMISIGSVELSNALLIDARAPLTDGPFDHRRDGRKAPGFRRSLAVCENRAAR